VWSFGVIISELLSRRKPYYGKITNEVSTLIESVTVTVRDGPKKRKANNSADTDAMPFHEDQLLGRPPKALVDLMRRCLSLTLSARPSFSDAVEVLEELKQSLHGQSEDENEAAVAAPSPPPVVELEVTRPKRLAKRRAKPAVPPAQADGKQEQPAPQAVVPTASVVLTPQQQPTVRRAVRRRNKVLLAPASASCTPTQDEEEVDKENVKPLANRLKKMRL
jgi:serine/threonine protein kinase